MKKLFATTIFLVSAVHAQQYQPTQSFNNQQQYGQQQGFEVGQVISTRPITESRPQSTQVCSNETIQPQEQNNVAPVIGGLVGAAIGNTIGNGRGRDAATILGAISGSMYANDQHNNPRTVQRCVPQMTYVTVTRGYEVTFDYNGRTFVQQMSYNPGQQVRVTIKAE